MTSTRRPYPLRALLLAGNLLACASAIAGTDTAAPSVIYNTTLVPPAQAPRRIPQAVPGPAVRDETGRPVPGSCGMPRYPRDALIHEQTGTVHLRFEIDTTGTVLSGEVLKSSGVASLDQEALTALGHCKYAPLLKDGQPYAGHIQVGYVFSLE